ncbi:PDGLE domain-containing protein [Pelosinus sp. sgz500959]|uniref:PDGLE domain-containing protein n=1 Tax=Pelosinus sp. sgz500959 TaxID=3242472 RepID=UPI00366E85C7
MRRYWIGLIVLAMLTPLGSLAEGTAWGEWGTDELMEVVGYIPQGIEQAGSWWTALFPDYGMNFLGEGEIPGKIGYFLSAVLGSGLIYALISLYGKMILRTNSQPVLGSKE